MDLRTTPAVPPFGEARLVFALTNGPGDDPNSVPMPMTVIFEYDLQPIKTLKEWAQAWHALGESPTFDSRYKSTLEGLTETFVKRGAAPTRPNGSALGQARTNESVTNWIWQLREFTIGTDGGMHQHEVRNTPAASFNQSAALAQYVESNAAAVRNGTVLLPDPMLAGSADELQYRWAFPGMEETLRKAFSLTTCNGCHSQDSASTDTVFHISPFQRGVAKVSPFLNNPADPDGDELANRSALLRSALCSP
jgi:hypothetical protein